MENKKTFQEKKNERIFKKKERFIAQKIQRDTQAYKIVPLTLR